MMTQEQPATLPAAPFSLHQCTTSELSRYRGELEHAVQDVNPDAPAAADLRRLLDDVLCEQEERARIAHAR